MRALTLGLTATLAVAGVPALAAAAATPDRAYEMVSPVQKDGNEILDGLRATANGDAVAFESYGAAGGAQHSMFLNVYVARRGGQGWVTAQDATAPAVANPLLSDSSTPADFSADLHTLYTSTSAPLDPTDVNGAFDLYAITDGGAPSWLTDGLGSGDYPTGSVLYDGRSADGSHVIVESTRTMTSAATGGTSELYDITAGGTSLVSVMPDGSPSSTSASLGNNGGVSPAYSPPDRTAVSRDGRRIVFSSNTQLYVRIDGTSTQMVSASHRTASPGAPAAGGATFEGASADGSRIVFSSPDQLVDDAAAASGGLYAYDVASDALTFLAPPDSSTDTGVVRVSDDGQRVFYVADRQLDGSHGSTAAPNLWVIDASGVHFIATLVGGDSGMWSGGDNVSSASITPDGRYLAFPSKNQLTAYDNASHQEVYLYDAQTGDLSCASCPLDGTPATGDAALQDATNVHGTGALTPRNLTDDGRLLFETPEPLVASDTNGAADVYERDPDGTLTLISSGTGSASHYVDNSADGRDVFIRTSNALVTADTDGGLADIYDARVGGGFPTAGAQAPCSGDACRGPQSAPPAAQSLGSLTAFDAGGLAPAPKGPTFKVYAISAAARSRFARTGSLTLKVRVSDAAVLTARGRATIGKHTVTVASTSVSRTSAGTVSLTLHLSHAARLALRRSGRLAVALTLTCSDTTRASHATLVLRSGHRKAGR